MKPFHALWLGLLDLFSPKIWLLVVLPPILAAFVWIQLFVAIQEPLFIAWQNVFVTTEILRGLVDNHLFGYPVFELLYWLIVVPAVIFFIWLTSVIIVGFMAVPWIKRYLRRQYPRALGLKTGQGFAQTFSNVVTVFFQALLMFAVLILFSWVPGIWAIGLFFIAGWVNTRLLFLEIFEEVSFRESRRDFWRNNFWHLIGIGLIFGFLFTIPIVGFFVPVWSALTFFHYLCQKSELEYLTGHSV